MRQKLTKKIVDAFVHDASTSAIKWDSEIPGFHVKVTPTGRRSYYVYYRTREGQQRRPKIGDHGTFTVDQAREVARKWLAQAALGSDISSVRQSKRTAVQVKDLADKYLADYAAHHKKPRSIATDRSNIENHVLPLLGNRAVRDVTRQDIVSAKDAICKGATARVMPAKKRGRRIVRGGTGIANRVLALLSKMFACAVEWGMRDDNPVTGVRKFKEVRKDRFLDQAEVARLLGSLRDAEAQQTATLKAVVAINTLLLTGMRYGEVLGLRWDNVDFQRRCFRIADTKTGARIIPMSEAVLAEIEKLERGTGASLLFEGTKAGSPISLRRPWYKIREAAGIDATATLHTLRHTFASWSVMGGLTLAQVGALLGHKSAQTTLRYADHALDALRGYSEQTSSALKHGKLD